MEPVKLKPWEEPAPEDEPELYSRKFITMADGSMKGCKGKHIRFDDILKRRFLKAFAETGRLMPSAHSVGIARHTIYKHRKLDPVFNLAYDEAIATFRDNLEREMYRRGVEGWDEPIIGGRNRDQVVCTVKKYSDKMLSMLAIKHIPDMSPTNKTQIDHKVSGTIGLEHTFDYSRLDEKQLEAMRFLLSSTSEMEDAIIIESEPDDTQF